NLVRESDGRQCGHEHGGSGYRFAHNGLIVTGPPGTLGAARGLNGIVDLSVKQARVVSWPDVGSREAALIQRCAEGDETACAELVAEHQRMVVQLAMNLLGDRDEALD